MKFLKDTFALLKDTTWPTGKQSWIDFISIMEYTAFFVISRTASFVEYLLSRLETGKFPQSFLINYQ